RERRGRRAVTPRHGARLRRVQRAGAERAARRRRHRTCPLLDRGDVGAGYREGPLALAHNGNLTNAVQLRSDLVAKGSLFQSSSDSEVLVHLIARSEAREPEDQLLDALERVEGAYSLLITVGRTLYAIVDPRGFRP